MAVHAIEWQISQRLERVDKTNWDQIMDHFLSKGIYLSMISYLFHEVYIHGMFWP